MTRINHGAFDSFKRKFLCWRPDLERMVAIYLTCMLVYLFFWSGHHYSIDGVVMFEYAKSLLFQGSHILDPPVYWGTHITVSKWPIGLTLLYMPILALLSSTIFVNDPEFRHIPFDPGNSYSPILLDNRAYRYSSFAIPMATALTAALLYVLCLQLGLSKRRACAAALVFGIASPASVYAKFDYAQPLASLLILIAVILLIRAQHLQWQSLILPGVFLGVAVLVRPEVAIFPAMIFSIAAYFIQPANSFFIIRRLRNLFLLAFPIIGFVILNQYINTLRFGGWFSVGYQLGEQLTFAPGRIMTSFLGHLISPGRGILFFFPLSILSLFGIRTLFRRDRVIGFLLTGTVIGSILVYSTWVEWAAGISWGPRFLIPIIPYLTLLAFLGYDAFYRLPKSLRIACFGVLILLGWLASLQGMLFNFLDYYRQLSLSDIEVIQGYYNFTAANSPLLSGWAGLLQPSKYDIFWFQNLKRSSGQLYFAFLTITFLLGFAAKYWFDFAFLKKNTDREGRKY